jgi:hypothetical protein
MAMTTEQQQTRQKISRQTKVKKLLFQAYSIIKENKMDFPDKNISIHVGSIMNKWFGGTNDEPVAARRGAKKRVAQPLKIFKPNENDFKKKSVEAVVVAPVDLDNLTLPELKQMAKSLGIKFTGRSRDELLKDITWHRKGLPVPDEDELADDEDLTEEDDILEDDDTEGDFDDDEEDDEIDETDDQDPE